ncbi:MAG: hypothetical protein NC340_00400 [Ruminococcus flavefaciens]|nr:hypothetical protein [Ruminococcus flavefaciens]MCM1228572.1 hypothetical protein [Ruminococcus flavefaciens]
MSYYESPEQRRAREFRNQIRNLENNMSRLNQNNSRLQEQLDRAGKERKQAEQRFNRVINQQNKENQRLSQSLRKLNDEVERQEREYRQQVQAMQRKHDADIKRQNERIASESARLQQNINQTRSEMESFRRQTEAEFENIRAVRERDLQWARNSFQQVDQRIDDIQQQLANEKANQREIAEYWIQQAQRIRNEIRENYRPEKFEAEKWDKLNRNISYAESVIDSAPQASMSSGHLAFSEAFELRSSLIAQEFKWQETLEAVRTIQAQVITNIEDAKNRKYEFEMDGEKVVDDNGVDYWTYGQLSVLENRVSEAGRKLDSDVENLTTEQLEEYERTFAGFLEENALLENASHTNLAMARARVDMAEKIGDVLGDSFLMTEADGDYFKEEPREEYHAVFLNPQTLEEAVVVINPEPDENGVVTNHAEVIIKTPSNNAEDRRRINDTIVRNVAQQVEGFNLPCSEKYGLRTNEEAERLGNISAVSQGQEIARSGVSCLNDRGQIVKPAESH